MGITALWKSILLLFGLLLTSGCGVVQSVLPSVQHQQQEGNGTVPADTLFASQQLNDFDTVVTAGKPSIQRIPTIREQMQSIAETQERMAQRLDSLYIEVKSIKQQIATLRAMLEEIGKDTVQLSTPKRNVFAAEKDTIAKAKRKVTLLLPDTVLLEKSEEKANRQAEVKENLPGALAKKEDSLAIDSAKKEPMFPPLYHEALRYFMQRKYQRAKQLFAQLLQEEIHPIVRASIFYWMGEIEFAQGRYEAAIAEFEKVIKARLLPKADDALFMMAESALRLRRYDKAKQYYQRLIAEFPDSPFTPRARVMLQIL